MSQYDTITVEWGADVATLTFDNTAQRNALNLAGANELVSAATALGEAPDVRCVVLTHEGEFFGTGADLSQLDGDESDATYIRQLARRLHEGIVQLHQAETPVVGGAGFSLALAPDLLVLVENAQLEFAYPRIGLTGDGSATFFLPRLVGLRAAKEIALLDEPIPADRAVELGLATEVVPEVEFADRVQEVAATLAAGLTAPLGTTKRLLTESFDRSLESQLAAETDEMAAAIHTEDYRRSLDAFFGDGDAEFTGR